MSLTLGMIYSRQRAVPRIVIAFEKHLREAIRAFSVRMQDRGLSCESML